VFCFEGEITAHYKLLSLKQCAVINFRQKKPALGELAETAKTSKVRENLTTVS
jgi:hypothetical protein